MQLLRWSKTQLVSTAAPALDAPRHSTAPHFPLAPSALSSFLFFLHVQQARSSTQSLLPRDHLLLPRAPRRHHAPRRSLPLAPSSQSRGRSRRTVTHAERIPTTLRWPLPPFSDTPDTPDTPLPQHIPARNSMRPRSR
ncbi:hypothetical protein P280DRAFT_55919 [Massarina eburnea CBS 473.64]|uniref:Uncharacterized protein n=1 Tax=Massarina eburnea CBS 473.64 TaxID=1395130 RepID=A0A6A6RUB9_9PLEO|nr:hypothetical protein P280DRAFT_55919 [Massarina eburnea CBS 473.64]